MKNLSKKKIEELKKMMGSIAVYIKGDDREKDMYFSHLGTKGNFKNCFTIFCKLNI